MMFHRHQFKIGLIGWAASAITAAILPGTQWWLLPPSIICGALTGHATGQRIIDWKDRHGRNRRTEEDHQDPEAVRMPGYYSFAFNTLAASAVTFALHTGDPVDSDGTSLEVVCDDQPILAHRYAKLVATSEGFEFQSVTGKGSFGIDADARCDGWWLQVSNLHRSKPVYHTAPGDNCQCGFYAVPADMMPSLGYSGVSLLVELSGKVIEHERGYRAEHQRIIQMTAPTCQGCGQPAERVWRHGTELTWDCGDHEFMPIRSATPVMACTLEQLSGALGVPIVKADTTGGR